VIGGGCVGIDFNTPTLPVNLGLQGTFLASNNRGDRIFMPTDERFTTGLRSMETVDVTFSSGSLCQQIFAFVRSCRLSGFVGPAWGQVTATSADASVTQTSSGWSGGLGISVPVAPNMSAGFLWRHAKVSGDVPLFGPGSSAHVDQRTDMFMGLVTIDFGRF
jgi:hypothetical protein